jgi:hypothetical protein
MLKTFGIEMDKKVQSHHQNFTAIMKTLPDACGLIEESG